jgi:hypothetical protein
MRTMDLMKTIKSKKYLAATAIAASLVTSISIVHACTNPGNSQSQQPQEEKNTNLASMKTMKFKFEDYQTAETAQAKLNSLFSKGTSVDEFKSQMKDLGADCYDPDFHEGGQFIACHYREKTAFLFQSWWFVKAELDDNSKINIIKVERGVTAP